MSYARAHQQMSPQHCRSTNRKSAEHLAVQFLLKQNISSSMLLSRWIRSLSGDLGCSYKTEPILFTILTHLSLFLSNLSLSVPFLSYSFSATSPFSLFLCDFRKKMLCSRALIIPHHSLGFIRLAAVNLSYSFLFSFSFSLSITLSLDGPTSRKIREALSLSPSRG
jgi:hypothetical protein